MSNPSSGPTRNNPASTNKVENPVATYYSIKGSGKIETYSPETKEKGEAATALHNLSTLATRFFIYGFNETTGDSWKSTEYAFLSETVRIYHTKKGERKGTKIFEGRADSPQMAATIKELSLSKGCAVYAFEHDTDNLVRLEMPATQRGLFMTFREAVKTDYPDFSISGFVETTKEDRAKAKERAGRTVSMPDFYPVFEAATVPAETSLDEPCAALEKYFVELRGGKIEEETTTTDETPKVDDLPFF
jgi:hypothetical protein